MIYARKMMHQSENDQPPICTNLENDSAVGAEDQARVDNTVVLSADVGVVRNESVEADARTLGNVEASRILRDDHDGLAVFALQGQTDDLECLQIGACAVDRPIVSVENLVRRNTLRCSDSIAGVAGVDGVFTSAIGHLCSDTAGEENGHEDSKLSKREHCKASSTRVQVVRFCRCWAERADYLREQQAHFYTQRPESCRPSHGALTPRIHRDEE